MPHIIKPAPHHQLATGVRHDLPHLLPLLRGVAIDPAMFAARFLRLQGAFHPAGNPIGHKGRTFGTEPTLAETRRQREGSAFGRTVLSGAVHLDKLSDQPDIAFLPFCQRIHVCDHAVTASGLT